LQLLQDRRLGVEHRVIAPQRLSHVEQAVGGRPLRPQQVGVAGIEDRPLDPQAELLGDPLRLFPYHVVAEADRQLVGQPLHRHPTPVDRQREDRVQPLPSQLTGDRRQQFTSLLHRLPVAQGGSEERAVGGLLGVAAQPSDAPVAAIAVSRHGGNVEVVGAEDLRRDLGGVLAARRHQHGPLVGLKVDLGVTGVEVGLPRLTEDHRRGVAACPQRQRARLRQIPPFGRYPQLVVAGRDLREAGLSGWLQRRLIVILCRVRDEFERRVRHRLTGGILDIDQESGQPILHN
jgi:hypothetical protein